MSGETRKNVIFIVDDDPVSRDILTDNLMANYEIRQVESGSDLLMLLETERPDVILLDVEMPGLDGYETCRRVRERLTIPVVFITAHGQLENHKMAFAAGGDDFIAKPFDSDILLHVVARTLRAAQQAEALAVEHDAMRQMTMTLLSVSDHNGMVIDFLEDNIGCMHYENLCRDFAALLERLQIVGALEFRLPVYIPRFLFGDCHLSPLEEALLQKEVGECASFGYKERYFVQGPHLALLVLNVPTDVTAANHLQQLLQRLERLCESLIASVEARSDAPKVIENLQVASLGAHAAIKELSEDYRQQQLNSGIMLHGLIDKIEASYYFLGLSQQQEEYISNLLSMETDAVLALFQSGMAQLDEKLVSVMDMLVPPQQTSCDVWL